MTRKGSYGVGALVCAALWIVGLSYFVEGDKFAGGALIVVAGLGVALLARSYNRDPTDEDNGLLKAILDVLNRAWPG